MAERDFDSEFSILLSGLAAEDPELTEHYRAKMHGEEVETEDWEIEMMIRVQYDQTPGSYKLAVARCVGKIAGVQFGREMFHG
jgi:hypothetical protein